MAALTFTPYGFSVNGSAVQTALMCLDYNREITFGEKWAVARTAVPLDSSTTSADYRADAWLFSQLKSYSTEDVQYAVWSIFDPKDAKAQPQFSATAGTLAAQAMSLTANASTLGAAFYGQYQLYLPTNDQTGWTAGIPQDFLGAASGASGSGVGTVAATPEPASLALVGTGLLSAAGALRRRKRTVTA